MNTRVRFKNIYLVKSLLSLASFFLFSCSLPLDTPIIDKKYRLDLEINNMGNIQTGLVVLSDKPLYTLDFKSKGDMDYLSFNSCSTTVTKREAGGIFNKKEARINFRPNEIEKELGCDVKVDITNKKSRHTFGFIAFENKIFDLEANVICGETTKKYNGVSVCQSYAGNLVRIRFSEKVKAHSEDCKIISEGDKFDINSESGFCNYYFIRNGHKHRLLVYGWTDELLN